MGIKEKKTYFDSLAQRERKQNALSNKCRKVLFFSEGVTLAHVARPLVLAERLKQEGYDVHVACRQEYRSLWESHGLSFHPLDSIDPEDFLAALARGHRLYNERTLLRYVEEDLALIRTFGPDLVVGDFRLSLALSAAVGGVPYVSICNAYWSPYLVRRHLPVPAHPLVRCLGVKVSAALFNAVSPMIFAYHCLPMKRVRRAYGLPGSGHDLRRLYTEADVTLYADAAELFPMKNLPHNHAFLGPIVWTDAFPVPGWWQEVPEDKPVVYLSLGSSGPAGQLSTLLDALVPLPITLLVSTAAKVRLGGLPANVFAADFLPGYEASRRASLVICNGGSLMTQLALACGVPLIGICSNLDQYLNMEAIEKSGAGLLLRAGALTVSAVRRVAEDALVNPEYKEAAQKVAGILAGYNAPDIFTGIVGSLLES